MYIFTLLLRCNFTTLFYNLHNISIGNYNLSATSIKICVLLNIALKCEVLNTNFILRMV